MVAKSYTYPWREHNQLALLVNGENYYPDILQEINNSSKSIYIIQYLVRSGNITNRIIEALTRAVERGVHVCLILDDYGSSELSISDKKHLTNAGIRLVLYNAFRLKKIHQYFQRDHRKLYIIDDRVVYTGGAGICDEFDTANNPQYGWQDIMVKITGNIAMDCYDLFATSWNQSIIHKLAQYSPAEFPDYMDSCRMNIAWRRTQEINRSIVSRMGYAQDRIVVITPYFVTTWKIRRRMRKAGKNGINVKLIVPGPHSDHPWINHISRYYYSRLIKNNVQIYEYQPRFLHTKMIVCDDWINIGSSNLDRWNMRFNKDANIEIRSHLLSQQVNDYIQQLEKDSTLIDMEKWQKRPLLLKIRIWFWSRVALWLERLTHNRI